MIIWIIIGYFTVGFLTSVIVSLVAYEGDRVELGFIVIIWPLFIVFGVIWSVGKIVRMVADLFRDKNISLGE